MSFHQGNKPLHLHCILCVLRLYLHLLLELSAITTHEVGGSGVIFPIFQVKILRFRGVKEIFQSHEGSR